MKRRALCLLLALALLCAGCVRPQPQTPPPLEESEEALAEPTPGGAMQPPTLEDYLDAPDIFETPVRDYGESVSHMQMEETFLARILYPVGGLAALDEAVEHWVQETAAFYQTEAAAAADYGDSAELTVDYSSYRMENTPLVSVKLMGVFDAPFLAHPIDVSASFNADAAAQKILGLEDILLPGGEEALRELVIRDAGIEREFADEKLLEHWLLTPEGLEITLVRGDYLAMSEGTVVLLYPYEALKGIVSLFDAEAMEPQLPETSDASGGTEASPPPAADPSKPMLALTFDDGPSAHTERLLDAFAAHGGKGTFYVVGNMLDARPDTLRRMAAEGHEIGGHSWNHRQLTKLGAEELTDQLMTPRAKIYSITGLDTATVRPPYGACNDAVKAKAGELGLALVNWTVDTLDWKYKDAELVYRAVMDGAKDGAIILCHDLHKTTVDAMERAIPDLITAGYQLVSVTELLTSGGGTLDAGTLYFKR